MGEFVQDMGPVGTLSSFSHFVLFFLVVKNLRYNIVTFVSLLVISSF